MKKHKVIPQLAQIHLLLWNLHLWKASFDLTALYAASRKQHNVQKAMASKFINDDQQWHNGGSVHPAIYRPLY